MKTAKEFLREAYGNLIQVDEPHLVKTMERYSEERLNEGLILFKQWYDKLSPADKCTVWPPAGSGSGHGLYNQSDEDIVEKFLRKKS